MSRIISYNDIIEIITDIARRHYILNTFVLGKNWELENNKDLVYPVLQVFPEFAKMPINDWKEYKTLELSLNCKVIDLTTPGEENEKDVHSDTLRIAQDIVNELNQHPFYIRSNVSLMEDISFTAIEEFKDDISAGWQFTLKLKIINANTFCGMPIAELPGYSANGPTSSGVVVNTQFLTCETLPACPTIVTIEDTLVNIQDQIDNLPPSALTLAQVLGYGNVTGGTDIVVNQADTISFLGNTNASIYKYTYNESFGPSQYSDLRVDGNTVYSDKVQVGMPPYWSFFRLPSYNSLGVKGGISIIANASIGSNTITFHSVDSGSGLNPIISEISVNSVTGVMTYNNQLNIATKLLVDTIEPYSSGRVFVGSAAYGVQLKGTIDVTSLTSISDTLVYATTTGILSKITLGTGFDLTAGLLSYTVTGYVPYTGATSDVDLGAWTLNAGSIKVNGTNGGGHIHFKHQVLDAPSQANSTTLFADVNGDIKYKNDSLYYTTFKTSLNTADRVYTFQDISGTIAMTSDITPVQTQLNKVQSATNLFNYYNFS